MNISQSYPLFSANIAEAIEQLGNVSDLLLQSTEQASHLIANKLLAGGKLLLATDLENTGTGEAFRFELIERHKLDQPGLPIVALPYCANNDINSILRSAETLGQDNDILLVVSSNNLQTQDGQLDQLHLNRGISSIYLGQETPTLGSAGYSVTLPLSSANKYRSLEMNLFILHCLSVRIQSIVFQAH